MQNIKQHIKYFILYTTILTPFIAFAQSSISTFLTELLGALDAVIRVVFALSLVYFFWGASEFILHANEQKSRDEGKKRMFWGVIVLFLMVSIYGILNLLTSVSGIPQGGNLQNMNPFSQ